MAFAPTFGRTFQPTFDRRNAGGYWWNLFGAIPNANVLAAYQPKGAADLAASYVNLVTPGTYDCTKISLDPAWDSTNGWKPDGGAAANKKNLDTHIVATNSQSAIIRYSNWTGTQNYALFGHTTSVGNAVRINIYPSYTGPRSYFRSGGNFDHATVYTGANILAITPAAAYANGSNIGSITGNWTGSSAYTIKLFHETVDGAPMGYCVACYVQAVAFYNITLTDGQVAALTTAINAL